MVNVGYDDRLSEHLAVEDLGLLPLYQGRYLRFAMAHCVGSCPFRCVLSSIDRRVLDRDAALDHRVLQAPSQRASKWVASSPVLLCASLYSKCVCVCVYI